MFTPARSRRRFAAALTTAVMFSLALGASVVISVVGSAPASAHAALVRISPGADAVLTTVPSVVVLEFDEPVSSTFATVVVSTAAGTHVTRGQPVVVGAKVTQSLSPAMAAGSYRVAYRVVSVDGHPVTGESAFTLTLASATGSPTAVGTPSPSTPSPSTTPEATVAAASSSSRDPGGQGWPAWIVVPISVGALLAGGAGAIFWHRQRR
ncbi:MAG: copper resistance CopC family protein [Dermatophilaceae bacterium]